MLFGLSLLRRLVTLESRYLNRILRHSAQLKQTEDSLSKTENALNEYLTKEQSLVQKEVSSSDYKFTPVLTVHTSLEWCKSYLQQSGAPRAFLKPMLSFPNSWPRLANKSAMPKP